MPVVFIYFHSVMFTQLLGQEAQLIFNFKNLVLLALVCPSLMFCVVAAALVCTLSAFLDSVRYMLYMWSAWGGARHIYNLQENFLRFQDVPCRYRLNARSGLALFSG